MGTRPFNDRVRLDQLEKTVENAIGKRGDGGALPIGRSLLAIKEEGLHKPLTFDEYVERRWGFPRDRVKNQMKAAEIEREVSVKLPSRGHYRALSRLPEHQREEVAHLIEGMTVRDAEARIRKYREENGVGKIRNRHTRIISLSEELAHLTGRWSPSMCKALTPPEAQKQLRTVDKAIALLEEVREAVDYRAQTMHTWMGR